MANGMTIDKLYEAFMDLDTDDPTPFAEDVFTFFGKGELGGYDKEAWAREYGTYLPTWDPSQVNLATRERSLDYRDALDTLRTTQEVTDRVYTTELDTLSTSLGKELSKGREIAGRTGLRSGGLESAIQDTIATTGSKAKDFGDRTRIAGEDTKNKYNSAMVDAALDFEKTERQEKEEFYDRTMAAIMRLTDTGAFDDPEPEEKTCAEQGLIKCNGGSCEAREEDCPGGLEGIQLGVMEDWETLKTEFDNCNSMNPKGGALDACWEALKAGADAINVDPWEIVNWAFPDLEGDYKWWEENIRDEAEDFLGEEFVKDVIDYGQESISTSCKNMFQAGCASTACLGSGWPGSDSWHDCIDDCVRRNC